MSNQSKNLKNKAEIFLDKSLERNIIFGAYLFVGPKNSGKFETALKFAREITERDDRKINPDIIIINPEEEEKKGIIKKKDIKVEKIREMEHELSLSPHFGRYKVAIIREADRLTRAAQNALLKTLEEPREKVAIILVAHNQEKILATVKSRCVIKKFNPSILEISADVVEQLKKIWRMDVSEKFSLAEELSKNTSELPALLEQWMLVLRENILNFREDYASLRIGKTQSFQALDELEKSRKLLQETNANARGILENLFLKF